MPFDSLSRCFFALTLVATATALGACGGDDDANACQVLTDQGGVTIGSGLPGDPAAPEPASGYKTGKKPVHARSYMVVSANPLATQAGCKVLKDGGSAVDAAVAVQMVLGLAEPQSSGLGGGAFMLHYDAQTRAVVAYDGRETAPAASTENDLRWIDEAHPTAPLPSARASGRSIGTPGLVRMLELAHQDHGRLPWRQLFKPAIRLANEGFPISGRLSAAIEASRANLLADEEAAAVYFNADKTPKALGTPLKLPAYADTLNLLAREGADGFYRGPVAQSIVDKVRDTTSAADGSPITPGRTTLDDLAGYEAKRRDAVCTTYRTYRVCGMPPPSSGGITVAATLGILENFDLAPLGPKDPGLEGGKPQLRAVHLVSEAERLAYADRDRYIADTDFVPLPGGSPDAMLDKDYLKRRAALIRDDRSMGTATAGEFGTQRQGVAHTPESGTTQVTIVDASGDVVSMTSTVESSFGSYHMTRGFVLNNQLTDFAASPTDSAGLPVANRLAAGKRPRSSMAPTLVFERAPDGGQGEFLMATGSPGGGTIIQYVVKTLIGVLDWRLDAQQASSLLNFGAANTPTTNLGGEHPSLDLSDANRPDPLVAGLRELGHGVSTNALSSGTATIVKLPGRRGGLVGGADPRREGLALGDSPQRDPAAPDRDVRHR